MLKSYPPVSNQVIIMCRTTTLVEKHLKRLCNEEMDVFNDEYSNQSSEEIEQKQTNTISLTIIFEIVPSRTDGNCLFHTLNNYFFLRYSHIKDLREYM